MDTSSLFGHYVSSDKPPRQWLPAVVTSSFLYAGIIVALVLAGASLRHVTHQKKPLTVKFVQTVVKPKAPPKPVEAPPPPIPKATNLHKHHVAPPPKHLVIPKELPKNIPAQAEPGQNTAIEVWQPDESELESGMRVSGGTRTEITEQMKGVTRARPYRTNEAPEYPPTAQRSWRTDHVVLKIRITTHGYVRDVHVMKGSEPFVDEAEKAVKRWRYHPARYHGEPISVYRIIKIAFQLT